MRPQVARGMVLLLTVAGLLAGCAPQSGMVNEPVTTGPTPAAAERSSAAATPTPAPTASEASSGAATPTARAGLEATDPTSVSLTSGQPQLVEFFAFW